jgi:hypothetical protein
VRGDLGYRGEIPVELATDEGGRRKRTVDLRPIVSQTGLDDGYAISGVDESSNDNGARGAGTDDDKVSARRCGHYESLDYEGTFTSSHT